MSNNKENKSGLAIMITVIGFIVGISLYEGGLPFFAFVVFILAVALAFSVGY